MHEDPFGLLITWTCYGTWLPGDARGFVSNQRIRQGGFIRKINFPCVEPLRDDEFSRHCARRLQQFESVRLETDQALVVAHSMAIACRDRNWRILRAAIMANHVHVVVVECPDDGPAVRRILKGVAQADVRRKFAGIRRAWTKGGSNPYLHGHESIKCAVQYVAEQAFVLVEIDDMVVRVCREPRGLPPR